jgi:hypothetical protein
MGSAINRMKRKIIKEKGKRVSRQAQALGKARERIMSPKKLNLRSKCLVKETTNSLRRMKRRRIKRKKKKKRTSLTWRMISRAKLKVWRMINRRKIRRNRIKNLMPMTRFLLLMMSKKTKT